MVQINPSDLPALPVEQLAQFLLGCAREDPTLLARSNSGPVVTRDAGIRVPLGEPIDLAEVPDDTSAAPIDGLARPGAAPSRPVGPSPRPIVPSFGAGVPSPRPVVPSFSSGVPSPQPVVPFFGPGAGSPPPGVPAFEPIDVLPSLGHSAHGPVGSSLGTTDLSAAGGNVTGDPPEPAAGPLERIDATPVQFATLDGTPGSLPGAFSVSPPWPVGALPAPSAEPAEVVSGHVEPAAEQTESLAGALSRPMDAGILVDRLGGPVDATARLVAQKLQLRRSDARDDPELEELVSIAVACARRAEDAVQQAREISWLARRRLSVVAAVAGAGVLAASGFGIVDRYQATSEQPRAFVTGPMTQASGEAPARDAARAVAEVSPPVNSARPALPASAIAPPGVPAAPAATRVAAAVPPPIPSTPAPVATALVAATPVIMAAPPSARPPATVAVASAVPLQVAPTGAASVAAAVPPPAEAVDPTGPSQTSAGWRAPAPPVSSEGEAGVVSASLDASPGPQMLHPVRHPRKPVRRRVYYAPGPGLLLAQVVYGVRRNLYEIFH